MFLHRNFTFSAAQIYKLRSLQSSLKTLVVKQRQIVKSGAVCCAALCIFSFNHSLAHCDGDKSSHANESSQINNSNGGNNGSSPSKKDDAVTALLKSLSPTIQELGVSGAIGVCAGYSLKYFGKQSAIAIGVVFAGLQTLQYLGYININHQKLVKDVEKVLDANGDGKIDEKDAMVVWEKIKHVLSYGLPNAAGFATGFALGVYYG